MFSLHLPRRLAPITRSFAGIDRGALLVLVLALVSCSLILAALIAAA